MLMRQESSAGDQRDGLATRSVMTRDSLENMWGHLGLGPQPNHGRLSVLADQVAAWGKGWFSRLGEGWRARIVVRRPRLVQSATA